MKIGYGTYGMKGWDIFDAVPRLRKIGYEMLEVAVAPDWQTAPEKLSTADRGRLRGAIEDAGFPPPVLLAMVAPCAVGSEREPMLASFDDACRLAAELNFGDGPAIVTSTLGGRQPDWDTGKHEIAAAMVELAGIGARHNVIFAIEPHIGGALDTPQKGKWLVEQVADPFLRLNFDYSHFSVQGIDLRESIAACLPYAVHTHIKDGWLTHGKVTFVLPGDGDMDLTAYFRALFAAHSALPVCVEVSGMVWNQPDYDPWDAARRSFSSLSEARSAAQSD